MEQANSLMSGIHQEYRDAVRHGHPQQNPVRIRQMSVGFRAWEEASLTLLGMTKEITAVDLVRVDNVRESEAFPEAAPALPCPGGGGIGEEREIPHGPVCPLCTTCDALDQPRKPGLPFWVDPTPGIAGAEHFFDSMGMNPGA